MDEAMPPVLKRLKEDDDPIMAAKKRRLSTKDFEPRSYQVTILEEALKRNTIVVLDTGSGKTMIALMLIKDLAKNLGVGQERRRLFVFLAPTVHLVHQQYEVVKAQTNLSAAQYYGALAMDRWNVESWEKEISAHQVIVMTPQILLNALRKAFLTLDMIQVIIFDECHRATGNHSYAKIMKEFYCKSVYKPKIFGMTASPLTRKGVSSVTDCEDQLSQLESILDSKIYTVGDKSQTDHFIPTTKEVNRYYDQKLFLHDDLKIQLDSLLAKLNASLAHLEDLPLLQFKDAEDILTKLKKDSSSWHGKICHCLDDLGLICANEAAKICTESVQLPCPAKAGDFFAGSVLLCKSFLEKMMHAIEDRLIQGYEILKTDQGCLEAIQSGYITPKLFELLQILKTFQSNQVRCLVFVERIITARVIQNFIKTINYLSHLKVSYLTGGSNSAEAISQKLQKETLELFRSGKVNLVFTTNVAEEGLDIPECSCVIRFDLPKTVCSYVQSRGRARQAGSPYIVMLERGNIQQRDLLFNIIRSKHSMMDSAINRDSISLVRKLSKDDEMEAFRVHTTGAIVTMDSSVGLIYRYCEKLPKDKYYTPRPSFQYNTRDGSSECTLTLPPGAAFPKLVGPLCQNNQKAKQLVCLDACKKLHQLRVLDDHLVPIIERPMDFELSKGDEKSAAGAGTTKRKELHSTVPISALSGAWVHQNIGVTLQGYKFKFLCDKPEQIYSSFVLLVDAALEKDVAGVEIDLYLVDKMVKASVSPCGSIHLDAEQVEQAKCFHELFFNGAFGKLFKGSKSSGEPRKLLFNEDRSLLWNTSYMYMLLPLESPCQDQDTVRINWKGIQASASVVDFLIASTIPEPKNFCDAGVDASLVCERSDWTIRCLPDMIHLANKAVHVQSVKDMVVMGIHTGKFYSIIDVEAEMSAESPFEVPDFATFMEYFTKKYGIVLQHPGQPLLLLKHSHNPHNLLSSKFNFEGASVSKKTKSSNIYVKKAPNNAHMPPELLVHIDVPLDVMKSLYLLPSLMHRMESLMLASQLRREIAFQSSDSCISSTLILEAITTLRCCEDFSLERLELLGDSVLKYALSCFLYLRFPDKHEGQLSSRRSYTVCNAMLHKLGVNRNLQGYIRDAVFDPRRWVAPGQLTNRPFPCKCGVYEVPYKILDTSNDNSIVIGKACDSGHRWICSKTISDCAEALIGAYYVGGGLSAAIAMMKWLGIDVECGPELIKKPIISTCFTSKSDEIETLEMKLCYKFTVKDFLLEAITHGSQQEIGINYCYQRLEFLGDAALDLVITGHLFKTYKDIDPGELTDLRSASISNENFARCAVRHKLQQHLHHSSGLLSEQIAEYVMCLGKGREDDDMSLLNVLPKGPKVLGDMVESIAGAILLDANLDLHKVWEIFEPLLSPIVTPRNLELPPVRELLELLSRRGYFLNMKLTVEGDIAVAQLSVQLEKVYLERKGRDKKKKVAKGQAALLLLKDLEKQGIITHDPSSPNQHKGKSSDSSLLAIDVDISMPPRDDEIVESKKSCDPTLNDPVVLSVSMKKGGPRIALNELCQKSQWARPRFESEEHKLSAGEKNMLLQFVSSIKLHIPNRPCISLKGEVCPDKKASQDSAAILMLYELQKQGRCCLKECD